MFLVETTMVYSRYFVHGAIWKWRNRNQWAVGSGYLTIQ